MYQNSAYRTSGGNNFLWVILSSLIIVILLFAVYINNRNSLAPVIAEVNQAAQQSANELLADSGATDSSTVVNPTAPTVIEEKPTTPPAEAQTTTTEPAKTEDKPAETKPAELKPEPKPEVKPATPAPSATGGTVIEYEIKKGDVMGRIISRYGNSKDEIMERNKLENLDKIQMGQKLKLRVLAQHKVGKNETVSTLASKYKVDAEKIRKANGLKDDKLKADETVIIPLP